MYMTGLKIADSILKIPFGARQINLSRSVCSQGHANLNYVMINEEFLIF